MHTGRLVVEPAGSPVWCYTMEGLQSKLGLQNFHHMWTVTDFYHVLLEEGAELNVRISLFFIRLLSCGFACCLVLGFNAFRERIGEWIEQENRGGN